MPNWVTNKLNISGPIEDVRVLAAKVGEPDNLRDDAGPAGDDKIFSFMNILCPWHFGVSEDDYFSTADLNRSPHNWYEWNWANWGTKWDACDVEGGTVHSSGENGHVFYFFRTAWNEPAPVIAELSRQFPMLSITHDYLEETGWGGVVVYRAGEAVETNLWDCPTSHAEQTALFEWCYCFEYEDNWPFDDCTGEE